MALLTADAHRRLATGHVLRKPCRACKTEILFAVTKSPV